MKILSGIDLIEISRIASSIEKYQTRFLNRIYTPQEQQLCGQNTASLAARFAAKEAVSKTLQTGIGTVQWTDIEILKDTAGAPILILHHQAQKKADQLKITTWSISLSHTKEFAIAMASAISD